MRILYLAPFGATARKLGNCLTEMLSPTGSIVPHSLEGSLCHTSKRAAVSFLALLSDQFG